MKIHVECEQVRRQAMLTIMKREYRGPAYVYDEEAYIDRKAGEVPVLVWPTPTNEGLFVVELQDGKVQMVQPDYLTFLDSKKIFDQYDWSRCERQ